MPKSLYALKNGSVVNFKVPDSNQLKSFSKANSLFLQQMEISLTLEVGYQYLLQLKSGSKKLSVPFLVTDICELERPSIGYNVIKEFNEKFSDSQMFINSLSSALPNKTKECLSAIISIIEEENDLIGVVKSGKTHTVIPEGASTVIKGFVHTGVNRLHQLAIFVPNLESSLVDCIDMKETLITVPNGSCCSFSIPIQNITDHDVVNKRSTITSQLFTVQSVITLSYQADRSENLFQASKVATEEAEVLNMKLVVPQI